MKDWSRFSYAIAWVFKVGVSRGTKRNWHTAQITEGRVRNDLKGALCESRTVEHVEQRLTAPPPVALGPLKPGVARDPLGCIRGTLFHEAG